MECDVWRCPVLSIPYYIPHFSFGTSSLFTFWRRLRWYQARLRWCQVHTIYLINTYCVPHFSLDTSALVHHLLAEHVCDDPMHIHTHCILHLFRYQRIIHFLDTSVMMPCIFIHTIYTSFISVPVINLQSGGISSLKKYLTVTKGWRPVGS